MEKLIFGIILLSLWAVVASLKYRKWHRREAVCTYRVSAVVTDVLERKPTRGAGMLYKPIYSICVDGTNHTIDSAYYSNVFPVEKGDRFALLVNPENYNEFIYAEKSNNVGKKLDFLCCGIMLIAFIGMFIGVFVLQ